MTAQSQASPSIADLKQAIATYYPEADFNILQKAHDFAVALHEGQKRKSGEPYIYHPLEVARILATMRMDLASIVAGILHDVVEDTATTIEEVQKEFGAEIAQLVDGVTKISAINFSSKHEKQAENFRKMILAMAKDIRVILVKLADRTHNMRTLQFLPPEKQERIATETLEIYAPLANRLGISWMKIELEDLGLRYTKSEVYYKIAKLIDKKKDDREQYTQKLIKILGEKINEYGLKVKISGRPKHFYSIYKKMETRNLNFEEIHDIVAFRVLTGSIAECYEVLGIVHLFFKPVPGRFKDYIAMPKNNMYQSLHTTVIGPYGERLEIQIRTEDMHKVAESGVAAHWHYKEGKLDQKDADRFHWLRQIIEAEKNLDSSSEFLESVKLDLFAGEIYIFTPKGELKEFPVGATPLDFAYSIHTDVGNKCVGAKVNGRMVPLKHKLRSGDTVEIVTSTTQKPSKDWLKIVKTGRAKSKIRAFIKSEERDRALSIGRDLMEKEFRKYGKSLVKFQSSKDAQDICAKASFASFDEMLVTAGYGKVPPDRILQKLFPQEDLIATPDPKDKQGALSQAVTSILETARKPFVQKKSPILIQGIDDVMIRFAKCCSPLPGDEIMGFISRGRGVIVHRISCPEALAVDKTRWVDVSWGTDASRSVIRDVKIRVVVQDNQGLMNEMTKTIAAKGVNIKSINIKVNQDKKAVGTLDLEVTGRTQLMACIKELSAVQGVISVEQV